MTFYEGIKKALQTKGNFQQGNYSACTDGNVTSVRMFGNKIFEYWHPTKTFLYSFCGYEGYPKTTRAINYCLDAVGAAYRVHTKNYRASDKKKGHFSQVRVVETKVTDYPNATGHCI